MPAQVSLPITPNPDAANFNLDSYSGRRGRPFLFQVVAPGTNEPLYPVLLALHVNPEDLEEKMTKVKTVTPTYGGFVEFNWPDDLSTLSANYTTGAFLTPDSGLTSGTDKASNSGIASGRRNSMAWERKEDLLDLFHNNGMVFDGNGLPAIRGKIMLIYDRGIFFGYFTTFEEEETDDHAWSFNLTWEFKVEKTVYRFAPGASQGPSESPQISLFPNPLVTPSTDLGPGF